MFLKYLEKINSEAEFYSQKEYLENFTDGDYQVWNPSYSIICYHKHKERDDNKDLHNSKPKQWLPGPYLFPDACSIEHMTDKNYKSYINFN
jgi:hypothetical protein